MKLTLNDKLVVIGDWAFRNCISINNITIPKSVKAIGDYAFMDCKGLTTVNFSGTKAEWKNIKKGNGWNIAPSIGGIVISKIIKCTDGDIPEADHN